MAERFYCPEAGAPGAERLTLVGDEAVHLGRVRRVRAGAFVEVFDGLGYATRAEVLEVTKSRVELRRVGDPLPDRAPALRLTLATAVPKGERFDWLVEKATELGVDRIIPLVTERSVVDPKPGKVERGRRVVIEAAKQSGRNRLLSIEPTAAWADLLRSGQGAESRYVAQPDGRSFDRWPAPGPRQTAVVAVGPEGGFTDDEVEAARAAGWTTLGLGATLLRIETAGLAACTRLLALAETVVEGEEGWDG